MCIVLKLCLNFDKNISVSLVVERTTVNRKVTGSIPVRRVLILQNAEAVYFHLCPAS